MRVTKEWAEFVMVWGKFKPMDFVRRFLSRDASFYRLTTVMLFLATDLERAELEGELPMVIAQLAEYWTAVIDGTESPQTRLLTGELSVEWR
jgi:hypothetical protein